jgi:hypothetical protein
MLDFIRSAPIIQPRTEEEYSGAQITSHSLYLLENVPKKDWGNYLYAPEINTVYEVLYHFENLIIDYTPELMAYIDSICHVYIGNGNITPCYVKPSLFDLYNYLRG